MIWLAIAVLVFGIYVWLHHRRRLKQFEDLAEAGLASIQLLFDSGDGATMVVRDMTSERFVQFRKYIAAPGQIGIETHFPSVPWSREYYNSVAEHLRKRGKDFDILTSKTTPTTELIHVDFRSNVTEAVEWAIDVFSFVFGCRPVRVRVRADDIHPGGAKVERADHERPIDALRRK